MCLYPRLIKNRKYVMNKKNGGNVPVPIDNRVLMTPIGCGQCMECRNQESRKWQIRLMEDVRENTNGHYVTLTFSNKSIRELSREIKGLTGYNLDNEIATIAVKRFRERWRKKYGKSVRRWLITELGHQNTENIHMHGIIWTDEEPKEIERIWQYGKIWAGYDGRRTYVNEKTVNYITKYVKKQDKDHPNYKAKVLCSPGIGGNYIKRRDAIKNKYKEKGTDETYKTRTGHKITMPVYWRNKIYTEEEREKLWIEKLDKQERWINGVRIDISKGEEEYYKALKEAQAKNKRIGYGSDEIDWEKRNYENQRRQLKIEERIKKGHH